MDPLPLNQVALLTGHFWYSLCQPNLTLFLWGIISVLGAKYFEIWCSCFFHSALSIWCSVPACSQDLTLPDHICIAPIQKRVALCNQHWWFQYCPNCPNSDLQPSMKDILTSGLKQYKKHFWCNALDISLSINKLLDDEEMDWEALYKVTTVHS